MLTLMQVFTVFFFICVILHAVLEFIVDHLNGQEEKSYENIDRRNIFIDRSHECGRSTPSSMLLTQVLDINTNSNNKDNTNSTRSGNGSVGTDRSSIKKVRIIDVDYCEVCQLHRRYFAVGTDNKSNKLIDITDSIDEAGIQTVRRLPTSELDSK